MAHIWTEPEERPSKSHSRAAKLGHLPAPPIPPGKRVRAVRTESQSLEPPRFKEQLLGCEFLAGEFHWRRTSTSQQTSAHSGKPPLF